MKKIILILSLVVSIHSQAIETDKAAHLGVAYAVNTVAYGIFSKAFHMPRVPSLLMAGMVTGMGCMLKEFTDPRIDGSDIFHGFAGIGLSAGTVLFFQF